jgi:hypothetical protein
MVGRWLNEGWWLVGWRLVDRVLMIGWWSVDVWMAVG